MKEQYWKRIKDIFFYNLRDCMGWRVKNRWMFIMGCSLLGVITKPVYVVLMLINSPAPAGIENVAVISGLVLGVMAAIIMLVLALALSLVIVSLVNTIKDKRTW